VTSLVIDGSEYRARFVLDATETGTLLRDAEVDHIVGAESRSETAEPNALEQADPGCFQAVTHCAALEWLPDEDFTIDKPANYEFWAGFEPPHWSGKLFSWNYPDVQTGETRELQLFPEEGGGWFTYRQIVDPAIHDGLGFDHPSTMVNWPQNDFAGPCTCRAGLSLEGCQCSRDLTLAWLYWMQSEAGFTGLRLSGDHVGSADGFAQEVYIRESRRISALETIKEQGVSATCHPEAVRAPAVENSIGIGAYRIDLHPRTNGQPTIDISALPYQIPLGALIPRHAENLLPACKNIGVTQIANGCTRLHPVEWNIGESAALLAAYCIREKLTPQQVHGSADHTRDLQELMVRRGIEIDWPEDAPLHPL
jgi:hypothetical protein